MTAPEHDESLTLEGGEVADELRRLAPIFRVSPARLLAQAVRAQLPKLRAAAIQPPKAGEIVSSGATSERIEAERLAVAAAMLTVPESESERPPYSKEQLGPTMALLARIGSHMLTDATLRALMSKTFDRRATWAAFPEDLRELAMGFSDSDAIAPLAMFQPKRLELAITFNVHGRFGLYEDLEIEPFGGATSIRLISGRSRIVDSGAKELVGVFVVVPIDAEHPLRKAGASDNDIAGPNWDPHLVVHRDGMGYKMSSPELDRGLEILRHILNVLRLTGRRVAFEPAHGELGAPWSAKLVLAFADGAQIRRSLDDLLYGILVTSGPSTADLLEGLSLDRSMFADAWDKARDVVAVLAGDDDARIYELFRQRALVVEARFNAPNLQNHRTLGKGAELPEFRQFVDETERIASGAHPTRERVQQIVVAIRKLRNAASHLARWTPDGKPLGKDDAYGLRVHDKADRDEMHSMLPVVGRLALRILGDAVPGFSPKRVSPLPELLAAWSVGDFVDGELRRRHAQKILERATQGERHPRLANFVLERIDARDRAEAHALAELCPAIGGEPLEALWRSLTLDPPDSLSFAATRSLAHAQESRERLDEMLRELPAALVEFIGRLPR